MFAVTFQSIYDLVFKYLFDDPLSIFLIGLSLLILFFWYFATEVEKKKRNIGTGLVIGLTGLCFMSTVPFSERLKGGIDIVGGSAFTLRIQPKEGENGQPMPITREQAEQAMSVIQKRLDPNGNRDLMITQQGEDGLLVQMPGIEPEESENIRKTLEKVAKLELHKVSERSDEIGPNGKTLAERVLNEGELVVGQRAFLLKGKDEDGKDYQRPILLYRRAALGGSDIANAVPSQMQPDAVDIVLNDEGTDKMIALTKDMRAGTDRIAIVLDGEVISAPVVQDTPLGKRFNINGLRDPGEPQLLANQLMNPLENPLVVEEMRLISPTLGKAVVEQGIWAGLIGLFITCIFVLIYYRLAGIIALFGLAVNGIILFGVMAMFGFTFSLPGIAGMILTIGMAVDANVLIYERLREEIANGKSFKSAIAASYEKAFTAIFDSNFTSLITAIILFWLGSGSIKGFAITLTIGIVASMFSAILVTRVLFRWGIDWNLLKKLDFLNLFHATSFDFLGKTRACAIASCCLVLLAFAAFGVRKEKAFGVDFTGGTLIQFQLGNDIKVPLEDVENALKTLTLSKAAYPQEQGNPVTGTLLTIRCDTRDAEVITAKLRDSIPALGQKETATNPQGGHDFVVDSSKEEVSAVIGGAFMRDSLIALTLGLIGIMIYITARFEFSFALGGFVAILHDVIISIGIVVLLGGELSLIHVGAILTIAGYSINDTIVVFDRIRENLLIRTGSVRAIMNEAINATLSRTLLTSLTTIVTVSILSLFGGSSLRDFSIMILIGLLVGTYSSIFIASPIVLWWGKVKGRSIREEVLETTARAESAATAP